jgi:hypothetical protein
MKAKYGILDEDT